MKPRKLVPSSVRRAAGRAVLKTKKNSPHILFGVGVGGVVTGTVLACRSTLKLEDTLDEIKTNVEAVRGPESLIPDEDKKKALTKAYIRGGAQLGKLYAPAIVVGGAGLAALSGAHIQLTRRNGALTVAYAGLLKAYDEYRDRVRAEVGEEKELELHHGIEYKKVDGEKAKVAIADPNALSIYAVIFDESNINYKKDALWNKAFLKAQQEYFNWLLQHRGHVFLNEVYEHLGFEHTTQGAVCGWVLNEDGDNYVDFGLYETRSARFINADERAVILDFNVDGVIYDQI